MHLPIAPRGTIIYSDRDRNYSRRRRRKTKSKIDKQNIEEDQKSFYRRFIGFLQKKNHAGLFL